MSILRFATTIANEEAKVYAAACFPGGTFVPTGENFLLYWCPITQEVCRSSSG